MTTLQFGLEKLKWKISLSVGGTVGSYVPYDKHLSVLSTGFTMGHVIYSLYILLTRFMWNYWMFLMSHDTERFPRLHYQIWAALWIRSNGIVFFLLAFSVCSAASGQFPHMMATFTLGSYTCTHLHSNANRNSLFC
jgi:hypothetical protein